MKGQGLFYEYEINHTIVRVMYDKAGHGAGFSIRQISFGATAEQIATSGQPLCQGQGI